MGPAIVVPVAVLPVAEGHDPEVLSVLIGCHTAVVLCGVDAAHLAEVVRALREGGARVAALIGDHADPVVEAAAAEMARELFGVEPVVVRDVSEARQFQARSSTVGPHPDM